MASFSSHSLPNDEPPILLFVGQHETQRTEPVTGELLGRAQDLGYDILTTPITTAAFQSRVLTTLEAHVKELDSAASAGGVPLPTISPLTPEDSGLAPEDSNSSLIAVTSPWIDIASPDPLMAHVSQQVFSIEIAYAAFCGINNVLVHGPSNSQGTVLFARALLEALGLGPYLQLHVLMPMTGELEQDISADGTSLAELARPQYLESQEEDESEPEPYASWEAWNTIRTMCSYSNKLSVGMYNLSSHETSILICSSSPSASSYFCASPAA